MNEGAAGREELGEEVGVTLSTKMYHGQPFSSHNMNAGALEDKYATAVNQWTKARRDNDEFGRKFQSERASLRPNI